MKTIGERIKKLRLDKNLTRKELGVIMGLNNPETRVGAYENNKKNPTKPVIENFAKALHVSEEYLITGTLDGETIANFYKDGLYKRNEKMWAEPIYLFQVIHLISSNGALIEECLDEEDFKKIGKLIVDKVKEKRGTLEELIPIIDIETYSQFMYEQAESEFENIQNLVEKGFGYLDSQGKFIPNEEN